MFFAKFPLMVARFGDEEKTIEDFFRRVVPGGQYKEVANILSPYFVTGDQRIEDVAFDLYGDQTLHWVILLCNNIINPYEEWPLADDILYRQIFDWYNFRVLVSPGHGLTIGTTLESSAGYRFVVESVTTDTLTLKSLSGVAYITIQDFLYPENTDIRSQIPVFSVEDPLNTVHHYEEASSGTWVDFDQDLLGQGIIVPVSNQDYEFRRNEEKRKIRVLDKKYLSDFIQTFTREVRK